MRVGLYFGSFNPIHSGHLIIANHILNFVSLDKICFVVSPQNPLKHHELLDAGARLQLTRLATSTDSRFEVSDIEFHLPKPSYTIDTLRYLRQESSKNEYQLIIGSDNFLNFSAWKSHEALQKEWKIIVYIRPGFPLGAQPNLLNVQVLNQTLIDISSTQIRDLIKLGKSVRYLVPEPVYQEIVNKNYYK